VSRSRLLPLSGILVALAAWQIAVSMRPGLIPGPIVVARAIGELAVRGLLLKYVVASLFRVTWGYLAALVIAVPLGLALGMMKRGEMAINPILQVLRPISPLAWIPIAILWFGVGDISAIFLIFLASLLPLTVATMNAVHNIDPVHLAAARNFDIPLRARVTEVLVPAILPQLIVAMRIALGVAWLVVVAAEMIAVNSGLGFLIVDARNAGDRYDLVIAGMVHRRHRRDPRPAHAPPGAARLCSLGLRRAVKVQFSDISMRFGAMEVLQHVTLDVKEGEFCCIVGPSGCGKSTLLNIAGGFLAPASGSVTIDGEPVTAPDRRRIFVFQERGVFPWLTVEGNIGFGLFDMPEAERKQRVSQYIDLVGLKGFEKSYPRELSGGMKQRVEVARALAVNPDVLFLDEPFGALDSITRLQMRSELLRIWRAEKKTVLFVTHDIEESVQLADRVVVMSARPGRIQRVVEIDVAHPRDLSSRRYIELRDLIFGEIGLAHQV